ncbi:MAG: transcriptional regulator [Dethiobacter sp.]|jgi:DNA-binding MarR family transcriptional regulator|nr:transcriptional regulator [Dethiobacter sp.]
MTENRPLDFSLDRVIHERTRLAILTYLAGSPQRMVPFTELKRNLNLSAGNLSVQLRNLEAASYVRIVKSIVGRKPVTDISITLRGFEALAEYIAGMEEIIGALKRVELNKPELSPDVDQTIKPD